jgi:hypothetical protein
MPSGMSKYVNKWWFAITILLNVVFAALFIPIATRNVGLWKAILYTLIGLIVIWIVYFIRAYIFGQIFSKTNNKKT